MRKSAKSSTGKSGLKVAPAAATVLRDAKTGQSVTVKGVGALKGADLKFKKGVSLLKPIAKQTLTRRSLKRKAG